MRSSVTDALLALAELGRELSSRNDGDRLVGALRVLEQRLGAARSVLYLADHERRQLSVAAVHGVTEEDLRPRYGAGVAGRVAASGQPVVVPVLRHDPMALSELRHPSRWAEVGWNVIAVPANVADRRAGVLCAYFQNGGGQLAEHKGALEVAAGLVCAAATEHRSAKVEPVEPVEPEGSRTLSLSDAVERLERQMIDAALRAQGGNVAAAARTLGTTERILRYKAQKLGIDPQRFKP